MRKLRRILPIVAAVVLLLGVVSVVHAAATVSTVAITSNPGTDNNYATGDTITVSLTFSEAVTVTGTPYVVLDIGEQPRHAAYSGDGSSTAAQPFSYTVLTGDKDTDGVSLQANSLTLNGGAILTTSDSTAATLTHSAMTFANHNVDNDITLVSNFGQTGATDHITISATQSATVSFAALESDVSTFYTLKEIALDVQTASPTLDVTINVTTTEANLGRQYDYVFSGSVANTGRQVFVIDDPYQLHAGLKSSSLAGFTYEVTITGSGDGTVEIGATASSGQDTGGLAEWGIADPPPTTTIPRFSLQGYEHVNPFITHAEIMSEPEDGMSYKAGERIEVLFIFNKFLIGTFPATADLWFGTGAAQRREASLVTHYPQNTFHHAVYAYTVQSGDADTDGILLGENPLGRNADFALALEPPTSGVAPHVPVDLTLSATQLGAGQLVDGSQERACVEVACIQLTVESVVETHSHDSGFYLRSDGHPFEYRGALSVNTFSYKGTSSSFLRVDVIEPDGELEYCARECVLISDPFLAVTTFPDITSVADHLGFVDVDGAVFHISEADTGFSGTAFWWTNPGFTWSDGDIVQIKLIENATASFDMASYTANEGDSFDVTVTLSDSFENTRTLPVVVTPNDSATEADYSVSPQELVFAPGETEKTFSVMLVDDTIDDDDETLTLSIDEPHIKSGGTNDTATVNITDNDDPEVAVQFGASAYSVTEGGTVEVTVTLDVDPERTVTVPLTVTDQDGASPADYSGVPAGVTFDSGEISKTLTFSATQDDVDDDGESVKLTFGTPPPRVSAGTVNESTVNIRDDDDPQVSVSFGATSYSVAEGSSVTVRVTLSADPARSVAIPITTMNEDGASNADYSGVPANVIFASGETEQTITFSATQDDVDDDGESVKLAFGTPPPRVSAGTPGETTVTITDDDIPSSVEVSFGSAAYTVTEGGTVDVTVILDDDPEQTVTVPIGTINEGGASGSDYSGVPATVTFSSGETEKTFTVTATEDNLEDGGERVKLSFVNLPPEATLGMTSEATVTIINKAAQNSLTVAFQSVAYSVSEGNSVVVTVILSAAPGSEVAVPLTVTEQGGASSEDYSGVPASVTFGPDERDQTFTVSATQDVVDDDEESVVIGFGTLSDGVSEGGVGNTTVDIRDDDDPAVVVSFGSATYTVTEGDTVDVTVTLDRDPERTVTIPIVTMGQDGASSIDYSGVPDSVTFNAGGPTEMTFTFTATQDTVDDEGESVLLGFGSDLSGGVSAGTPDETTVAITDDDPPEVSFGQSAYTVAEGGMVSVEVKLTSALGSAVTVPVTHTPQSATSSTDYSGVPANVMFSAGETSKAFTFTATQDTADDDGESVLLAFGTLPATVQTGTTTQTTVNITDDDDAPAGKVTLELTPATINESGTGNASTVTASVPSASSAATTVTVSVNPTDTTTLTGNTTLSIPAGDTNSTGVVTITAVNDDAYTGNRTVAVSGTAVNSVGITDPDDVTLTITDDDVPAGCESGDIWCGTVAYADRFPSDAAGRKPLRWYHLDSDVLEFVHNKFRYKVYTSSLGANPGGGTYVMPPFHIPERSTARIGLGNLSATDPMGHWEMPNQDYLDWTLYISTNQGGATLEAKLPFNEAKFCCGHKWRWYGLDLYALNDAWAAGKEYQLRIVEDPRADRTPEVLGPPLYLEALGVNRGSALVRWVRPQVRNDGAPPGVSYKVQWKAAAGEWGTPTVSEHVYVPLPGKEVLSWSIRGLTPGSAYDVRVIAVNEAGDSAPSNVLRVNTDQAFLTSQNQAANSPATGGPGITGRALAGETLTATTSGIEDEDGLADAVFAYQWIRQDLATLNDTDIEGAISSTYTVTAADEGKAIQVRVTFTDDAGNPESVTSDAMAVAVGLRLGSATLDGATLTLTYNDTLDTFVTLPPAAFTVSVNGGFRSVNAVSVAGASLTLTLASAAQAGDTVTVDYAKPNGPDFIRDTQGRVAASFSGRAVSNDTPPPALTAAIHGAPESHDGQEDFTFELRFSEAPKTGFSDETLRDDAFRVTGGEVVGARQLDPPGKVSWEISVSPASSGDVNVVLPVTEDCDADGAICTDDGTMLSSPLEFTVSGPTSEQASQQRQESTAATGSPTISGTVQVGQTLAASTTGITDPDGTTNAAYSYQWIANDGTSDSDIADATASAYTLVAGDAGKMIKVRVTFTDDAGNEEILTSAATAAVAAAVPGVPGILSVSVNDTGKLDVSWDAPDSNGGSAVTGYKVQWKEAADSWDTPAEVSETTVTGTSHTVTGLTDGMGYTFRVFAVNSAGDSSASDDASGTPRETTAPTVSSATVDGATLTVTFSEGLTETPLPAVTTFTANVGDNRRGVDSVAISGSTVTLTLASAVTSTDAVSVVYTVPSDAAAARLKDLSDNPAGSFTGQAVTNNTAAAQPLLTASIHDEPSSHDGQSEFTFELQFSEEPKSGFSYTTMRDHVFTVTGGSVTGARRLKSPSNVGWQINVVPDSNGDVTIVLPITEDCDAQGAICTGDGDGRPLSNRLEITVSGPTG